MGGCIIPNLYSLLEDNNTREKKNYAAKKEKLHTSLHNVAHY